MAKLEKTGKMGFFLAFILIIECKKKSDSCGRLSLPTVLKLTFITIMLWFPPGLFLRSGYAGIYNNIVSFDFVSRNRDSTPNLVCCLHLPIESQFRSKSVAPKPLATVNTSE